MTDHLPVGDPTGLSLLFHLNSEPWLDEEAYELASVHEPLVDPGDRPVVALPPAGDSPLVRLQRARGSCRAFAVGEMPLAVLADLLAGTQGIVGRAEASFLRRATPSAGGLFPLETQVLTQRVAGLTDGLHRYDALGHALVELRTGAREQFAGAVYAYPFVAEANAVVALVARFGRTQEKYGPRGYRYLLLEAGHCAQNLCLRAVELGLATLCIGGYADGALNRLLQLDPTRAGVVYLVAAGYAAV
jgi:SagB-type dehydrogenase family enzyme